jgi:hypothetical protein
MPKIKNISPLGELYVPSLNLTVRAGETAEVSAEAAASLLEQTSNWAAADKAAVSLFNAQSTIGE